MKSHRTGLAVTLHHELARSGQGTVYCTKTPGVLAKVYNSKDDPLRFEKIKVMVESPPQDPTREKLNHLSIAWPCDVLLDNMNRCAGFLMPHITNAHELTHVYNPVYRARNSPGFNWYYLHSAALNYVSALEAIHGGGHVVGDIKPQNILVNPQALISIIDTDSFQITDRRSGRIFRCPVGSEGFTPRELLEQLGGRRFTEVDRSEQHDCFGIAVIVYLLLFGRHPFMEGRWKGKGDPPAPDQRVLRGVWLHDPGHEVGMSPGTIPLDTIHPALEQCFRRCFIDGHREPGLRPSAREWKAALKNAIQNLARCTREPNHYYARHAGHCYWCARKDRLGIDIYSPGKRVELAATAVSRPVSVKTLAQRLRRLCNGRKKQ